MWLMPTRLELLEVATKIMLQRIRAGNDLTEALLARSREALARSRALLHQQKTATISLCDSNQSEVPAFSGDARSIDSAVHSCTGGEPKAPRGTEEFA
jgi:hypothetical protein